MDEYVELIDKYRIVQSKDTDYNPPSYRKLHERRRFSCGTAVQKGQQRSHHHPGRGSVQRFRRVGG